MSFSLLCRRLSGKHKPLHAHGPGELCTRCPQLLSLRRDEAVASALFRKALHPQAMMQTVLCGASHWKPTLNPTALAVEMQWELPVSMGRRCVNGFR